MKRKQVSRHQLRNWLICQAVLITIASTMTFAFLDFLRAMAYGSGDYEPIFAIGMIVPIAGVSGVLFFFFSRRLSRHINGLTDGLRTVADGDFSVKLDEKDGGPLATAYEDFNKMCMELQSVQTLRSDFVNNFSHEFKTPITAIAGFAELLQDPSLAQEERSQYLEVIAQESVRLAELSNSTLLLSRLDSQQFIPDRVPYSLDEQIKQCAILLSNAWDQKQLAFSADLQEVTYLGNAEMIRHVWLNLLNNAIKYTPAGGEVEVRMTVRDGAAVVSVTDTGIGMSPEVQARVFDKYYQGDASHAEKGLGLGLSIVHRIVELCGGHIEVESKEGEGSTFRVSLPLS